MDLSFSGAGFMGCYYFGVVDCINKYIPKKRVRRVAGASAGALIGAYYLLDLPLNTVLRQIIDMLNDFRRRPLGVFDRSNQIVDILPRLLDQFFPDDAHKRVSGRLFVGMTRWRDRKNVIVSEFESKKDLIDALNCSSFIPMWSGNHISTYKGKKHIDGGFTDNLPVFDEHTIRICCFSGPSDISPYDRTKAELLSGNILNTPVYLNFKNLRRVKQALFPPPAKFILSLLELGFRDTQKFLLHMDLIQCDACYNKLDPKDRPINSAISPTLTPSVSPALSRRGSFVNLSSRASPLKNNAKASKKQSYDENYNKNLHKSSEYLSVSPQNKGPNFASLLREKLARSCTPDSLASSSHSTVSDNIYHHNNNFSSPTIIVDQSNCASPDSGHSQSPDASKGRQSGQPVGSEKFLASRQTSQAQVLTTDKFTLVPEPLPSCPPSPNLNRHCDECIRLRQQARNDRIDEVILEVAKEYIDERELAESKLKNKLVSPIKWIRQLRVKSSYKFA